ncbi:MAG: acetyl-CoA C-acyltransferase [Planctomycetales bacterium]|nr:acetyl-CoA C-acyltransferase [Planctomycetales bacterium]
MKSAVVIDCCRTPVGRAHPEKGIYRRVRSDDLATSVVRRLVDRSGVDPADVEDLLLGCTKQQGEQGLNVARMVGLMAGLPAQTSAATINRLCGSSLQALNQASHAIAAGAEDVQIVGGLEHMHHIPMEAGADFNPRLFHVTSKGALHMGVTAEYLAQSRGIGREAQDEFALASHRKAAAASDAREFEPEIAPTWGHDEEGRRVLFHHDQSVRHDASLVALASLPPAFMPQIGSVSAGNSSPLSDGAAAMLVASDVRAGELGLHPLVRIRATAVAGVDPCLMGTGPVPAVRKALQRAGLRLEDIDLFELNEAFAAQALACIEMLDLDPDKVNVRGGAIAIGHPLGASGVRIATTLIHAMIARNVEWGVATMCIGLGQGIATIFQRV